MQRVADQGGQRVYQAIGNLSGNGQLALALELLDRCDGCIVKNAGRLNLTVAIG